jgi:hypothetical protein
MTKDLQTVINALSDIIASEDYPQPSIADAVEWLESLQSMLKWREALLMDATRYFNAEDDDAVAYFKALHKHGLTYKYSEGVNPYHQKTQALLEEAIKEDEANAALMAQLLEALKLVFRHHGDENITEWSYAKNVIAKATGEDYPEGAA